MNQDFLRKLTPEDVEAIKSTIKGNIACPYCHTSMGLSNTLCSVLAMDEDFNTITTTSSPMVCFICPNCGRLEFFDYGVLCKKYNIRL